jgi:5'-3' exonuclease
MGIPYFFYHICKKYDTNKIVTSLESISNSVDHLYFDYNSLIHPCAHEIIELHSTINLQTNEKELDCSQEQLEQYIIEKCLSYTRYLIDLVKPKSSVFIGIDGVAPRAKMNQQRERRFKSYYITKKLWDTNKITPGTLFMAKLLDKLNQFKKDISLDLNLSVIVSSSEEPGEGEHKIMHFMNNIQIQQTHIIYGLDADLIMLTLLHKWSSNIILFRDNSKFDLQSTKRFECLPINDLKNGIVRDILSNKWVSQKFQRDYKYTSSFRFVVDYIFCCFLLGNDFLPHLPSLLTKENGIHFISKCYTQTFLEENDFLIQMESNKKNGGTLDDFDPIQQDVQTPKYKVNWSFFYKLMNNFSKQESYFFKNKKNKSLKDSEFNLILDTNISVFTKDLIHFNQQNYKKRYYLYYGNKNFKGDIDPVILEYLKGLVWVLNYYNLHSHCNWTWYYPYDFAPFASDIVHSHSKSKFDTTFTFSKTNPLKSVEQLILVLPKESLLSFVAEQDSVLYNKLYQKLQLNTILEYYPNELILDGIDKEHIWECKPLMKFMPDEILEFLSN